MDFMYYIIGGLILYVIISAVVRASGDDLQKKFVKLGTLTGKTYSEIEKACGKPNAVSSMGNDKTLRQWMATGYHIALIFDKNDICEGVSHELST